MPPKTQPKGMGDAASVWPASFVTVPASTSAPAPARKSSRERVKKPTFTWLQEAPEQLGQALAQSKGPLRVTHKYGTHPNDVMTVIFKPIKEGARLPKIERLFLPKLRDLVNKIGPKGGQKTVLVVAQNKESLVSMRNVHQQPTPVLERLRAEALQNAEPLAVVEIRPYNDNDRKKDFEENPLPGLVSDKELSAIFKRRGSPCIITYQKRDEEKPLRFEFTRVTKRTELPDRQADVANTFVMALRMVRDGRDAPVVLMDRQSRGEKNISIIRGTRSYDLQNTSNGKPLAIMRFIPSA